MTSQALAGAEVRHRCQRGRPSAERGPGSDTGDDGPPLGACGCTSGPQRSPATAALRPTRLHALFATLCVLCKAAPLMLFSCLLGMQGGMPQARGARTGCPGTPRRRRGPPQTLPPRRPRGRAGAAAAGSGAPPAPACGCSIRPGAPARGPPRPTAPPGPAGVGLGQRYGKDGDLPGPGGPLTSMPELPRMGAKPDYSA